MPTDRWLLAVRDRTHLENTLIEDAGPMKPRSSRFPLVVLIVPVLVIRHETDDRWFTRFYPTDMCCIP